MKYLQPCSSVRIAGLGNFSGVVQCSALKCSMCRNGNDKKFKTLRNRSSFDSNLFTKREKLSYVPQYTYSVFVCLCECVSSLVIVIVYVFDRIRQLRIELNCVAWRCHK